MSEPPELITSPSTSAVRNTVGRGNEQVTKNSDKPASDAALREYCDKYYHQLLPIIAEKVHQEKVQQEKQKKCIKYPIEIHRIKQREGESTEDFVQRFKNESRHVKGAPECMRISRFMHEITNPALIKRLHDNILKLVDEMMRVTTAFLRGEVVASNHGRKKTQPLWKQQETGRKQHFEKRGDFHNQQRSERRRDKFTHLTKSPREVLALDKREAMDYTELLPNPKTLFPPLGDKDGTKGPMIIEAKIGATTRLIGFSGEIIWPIGQQLQLVKIGDAKHSTSAWMNFIVVRSQSPYNGIIGRPGIRKIQAIPSIPHEMLKFLFLRGVLTLRSRRIIPLECMIVSRQEAQPFDVID
uniref:Reverse transcriptase domain-containing protein n=1 Tax=Tanacetum cinerariifolium TaxID=118510 RepID=A0A699GKR4_TANCI|nr:reverse transcriptase domain-containing protein [Tanacetum cinerariifolium]